MINQIELNFHHICWYNVDSHIVLSTKTNYRTHILLFWECIDTVMKHIGNSLYSIVNYTKCYAVSLYNYALV